MSAKKLIRELTLKSEKLSQESQASSSENPQSLKDFCEMSTGNSCLFFFNHEDRNAYASLTQQITSGRLSTQILFIELPKSFQKTFDEATQRGALGNSLPMERERQQLYEAALQAGMKIICVGSEYTDPQSDPLVRLSQRVTTHEAIMKKNIEQALKREKYPTYTGCFGIVHAPLAIELHTKGAILSAESSKELSAHLFQVIPKGMSLEIYVSNFKSECEKFQTESALVDAYLKYTTEILPTLPLPVFSSSSPSKLSQCECGFWTKALVSAAGIAAAVVCTTLLSS